MELQQIADMKQAVSNMFKYIQDQKDVFKEFTYREMIEAYGKEGAERLLAEMEYISITLSNEVSIKRFGLKQKFQQGGLELNFFRYDENRKFTKQKKAQEDSGELADLLREWEYTENEISECIAPSKQPKYSENVNINTIIGIVRNNAFSKVRTNEWTEVQANQFIENKIQQLRLKDYIKIGNSSEIKLIVTSLTKEE